MLGEASKIHMNEYRKNEIEEKKRIQFVLGIRSKRYDGETEGVRELVIDAYLLYLHLYLF